MLFCLAHDAIRECVRGIGCKRGDWFIGGMLLVRGSRQLFRGLSTQFYEVKELIVVRDI